MTIKEPDVVSLGFKVCDCIWKNHDRCRLKLKKANWKYKLNMSKFRKFYRNKLSSAFEIAMTKNKIKLFCSVNIFMLCSRERARVEKKTRFISSFNAGKYDLGSICSRSTNLFYFLFQNFCRIQMYIFILFIYLFVSVDSIKLFFSLPKNQYLRFPAVELKLRRRDKKLLACV